jgi:hypothetical protein
MVGDKSVCHRDLLLMQRDGCMRHAPCAVGHVTISSELFARDEAGAYAEVAWKRDGGERGVWVSQEAFAILAFIEVGCRM